MSPLRVHYGDGREGWGCPRGCHRHDTTLVLSEPRVHGHATSTSTAWVCRCVNVDVRESLHEQDVLVGRQRSLPVAEVSSGKAEQHAAAGPDVAIVDVHRGLTDDAEERQRHCDLVSREIIQRSTAHPGNGQPHMNMQIN